jgi:hypothetical protein
MSFSWKKCQGYEELEKEWSNHCEGGPIAMRWWW